MKFLGPAIDLSTCVSAAKLNNASGLYLLKIESLALSNMHFTMQISISRSNK